MQYLRQSTSVTLKIGPFLDSTDGNTVETGLTITVGDVRVSKNGGNMISKDEGNTCTHDEIGIYGCPINAADTNTLGRLQLWVHESGALPVWHEYMVVKANVYDSMCSTDYLQTDMVQISSDSTAANNLESYCDGTTAQPVNITELGGVVQSLTDLKDFADQGYDPGSNTTRSNVMKIHDDDNAASNMELDYDGTGYAKINSTIGTCTTNTDMVATAPTAVQNRTEMDSNSTRLTTIVGDTNELQLNQGNWLTATGFNTVIPDVAGTAAGLHITTDGHLTDVKGTGFVKDTDSLPQCLTATGFNTVTPDAAGVAPTAVEIRTEIDSNSTRLDANISTRSTVTTAQVNAEVVDVVRVDTTAEMSQGAPPATPTMEEMQAYIYFRLRNKCTTTSTEDAMWDNAGTTKLVKATIGDNGTTFTKSECVSGA